jgi:hypothetical protein
MFINLNSAHQNTRLLGQIVMIAIQISTHSRIKILPPATNISKNALFRFIE